MEVVYGDDVPESKGRTANSSFNRLGMTIYKNCILNLAREMLSKLLYFFRAQVFIMKSNCMENEIRDLSVGIKKIEARLDLL